MKMQEIRRLYTEQAASLLAQGYTVYPDTMGGSQGEIAHIDFSNGSEILRLLLWEESDYNGKTYGGYIVITLGKCTDEIREGGYSTIWNNHLEVRSEIRLAKITRNWYTTVEESRAAANKRFTRWALRENSSTRELGDAYKSVALRWLQRTQKGFKSAKVTDITRVTRVNRSEWGMTTAALQRYEIEAKGKTYRLCPPSKG